MLSPSSPLRCLLTVRSMHIAIMADGIWLHPWLLRTVFGSRMRHKDRPSCRLIRLSLTVPGKLKFLFFLVAQLGKFASPDANDVRTSRWIAGRSRCDCLVLMFANNKATAVDVSSDVVHCERPWGGDERPLSLFVLRNTLPEPEDAISRR